MTDLTDRVALVAGGARGLGLAVAEALHAAGAVVVIADSGTSPSGDGADPTIAAAAARRLRHRAHAWTDSIASPGAAEAAVDDTVARFGRFDILVNGAGIRREGAVFELAPRDWEAVIRTNLSAAFYLTRAAAPLLCEQARAGRVGGRILNIGSGSARAAEAAALDGLLGLTRATALDLAACRATANAIVAEADAAAGTVAELAAWLASPAAAHVNGRSFLVRGRTLALLGPPPPAETSIARLAEQFAHAYRPA